MSRRLMPIPESELCHWWRYRYELDAPDDIRASGARTKV